jgi:DNA mismatch repair protein MutS2
VVVQALGFEGVVRAVYDAEAEVEVRGKRLRVPFEQLQVVAGGAAAPTPGGKVTVHVEQSEGPLRDLNVIGCTVDEALSRAEKYLDQALVQEQRQLRVIHGHGTGQLRRAIAAFLDDHPLVARFALAEPEQGGSGVTVIELKE